MKQNDGTRAARPAAVALVGTAPALPQLHAAPPANAKAPGGPATITLSAAAGLTCPAHTTRGADGHPAVPLAPIAAQRLAPLQTPTQLVVCRYRGINKLQLTGSRPVRSGLATAGSELTWAPRAMGSRGTCTTMA